MKINNCIFPIISKRDSRFFFLGNGFFLENKNFFVTAGHLFKEDKDTYAVINGELVDLNKFNSYCDYVAEEKQIEPIYKDLKIFKVDFDFGQDFIEVSSLQLERDINITSIGYHETETNIETPLMVLKDMNPNIERLEFFEQDHIVYRANRALIQSYKQFKNDEEPIFTNCSTCSFMAPSGKSGCPVLDTENRFCGMIILKVEKTKQSIFIIKEYIVSTLINNFEI